MPPLSIIDREDAPVDSSIITVLPIISGIY